MRLVGIVAEYNPFHKGHMYHIARAREDVGADGVAVLLSGSFVQRGEPAVFDKWERTRHALLGGADLVLELPCVYAISSAEGFARGAMETMRRTGVIDTISFGSECGDIEALRQAIRKETPRFQAALRENLRMGKSYAAAYAAASGRACALMPNNILAMEYLRFLGEDMHAHTIKRIGTPYNAAEIEGEYPSATAIREKLYNGADCTAFMVEKPAGKIHRLEQYESLILYALRTADINTFLQIPEVVRARLSKCDKTSLASVLETTKTKNITMASVKRALIEILLQNHVMPSEMPSYIRVLGFTSRGAKALKEMKNKAKLPIITRPAAFHDFSEIWETEKRATDIYFMVDGVSPDVDMRRAPIVL